MFPFSDPLLFSDIVRLLVVVAGAIGILFCLILGISRVETLRSEQPLALAHITLTRTAFFKLMALAALFGIPFLAMAGGTFALLEDTAKVSQCGSCHPMVLFVNDMKDPESPNLAARHYRNKWIQEEQCYHCHSDYGFQGTITAKLGGVGHVIRYLTGTYEEPIPLRGTFNNGNCLKCHGDTPKYDAQDMHRDNAEDIATSTTGCLTCHDSPHPSAEQRTPGSPDYIRLMSMHAERNS
jgi:cytochrome c nitrite reductase small subunit